ncbi:MAG: UvrD-helicase domain-containing protein [Gammaproteobacteria bacterium]|nr:UvrD-helicase domain-containing protein [Gammaproteobacteria bacterium]
MLNRQQRQAVGHDGAALLVLAGAGSGKTRVIAHKILHLIRDKSVDPSAVLAVTFTNKAAREMRERLNRELDAETAAVLKISTFHRFGMRFLHQHAAEAGLRPPFSILDGADSGLVVNELMRDQLSTQRGVGERVRQRISWWKNDWITPEQAAGMAHEDPVDRAAARVYGAYNRQLRAYNAVDLDDLVYLPAQLLAADPALLDRWRRTVRHILVDEYQDTNNTQYELIRLLAGDGAGLTVVGDDDQSIYAWRGARPENLSRLRDDFPRLEVVKLEQNYRSVGRILAAANSLIAHNDRAFEKRLWSELGPGPMIRVLTAGNEEREAERIAGTLMHHRFQNRTAFGDYAVLYRGNHQSRMLEQKMREMRIPYEVSGELSFFDRREIKDVLAYLRLVVNNDDDNAFLRTVNAPRRGIGPVALERLGAAAGESGLSLLGAVDTNAAARSLTARQLAPLAQFADWVRELGLRGAAEPPLDLVKALLADIDYDAWLYETAGGAEQAERRRDNVNELLEWIGRLQRNEPASGLAELLAHVALVGQLDRESDEERDAVTLMTLHAAKGLEYPCVFICGVEEELLPHQNSMEDAIEEERRLLYVGITRARGELMLSWARTRRRHGEVLDRAPSRFFEELPAELLSWDEEEARTDSVGRAHLDNIRALLG